MTMYILLAGAGSRLSHLTHFRTCVPSNWTDFFGQRRRWYAGQIVGNFTLLASRAYLTCKHGRVAFWGVLLLSYSAVLGGLASMTRQIAEAAVVVYNLAVASGWFGPTMTATPSPTPIHVAVSSSAGDDDPAADGSPGPSPTPPVPTAAASDYTDLLGAEITVYQFSCLCLFAAYVLYFFAVVEATNADRSTTNAVAAYCHTRGAFDRYSSLLRGDTLTAR